MSTTITPTVAAPPTTADTAASLLAYQTGQTGVVSDANPGSQVRTLAEGIGNVVEVEGVSAQATAFQAIVYGTWAAFGITPLPALQAQGAVTFSTIGGVATQNVAIVAGTVVQTSGGVQFVTTETVVLAIGTSSITATVEAVTAGAAGNVGGGTITSITSGIPYPLSVSNSSPTTGGTNAEPISGTQARFAAAVQAIAGSTPVAIANAAIGVTAPNSTEMVVYSTCFEPGVNPNLPLSEQTAGWTLYIDNGSGNASSALIAAVQAVMSGVYPSQPGYRDAGVPWNVMAVVPIDYSVVATGTLTDPTQDSTQEAAVQSAVTTYGLTLLFGQGPAQGPLDAVVGNTLANLASSFVVTLYNASNVPVTSISIGPTQRAILTSITVTLS
jgi:hypothetical protein